MLLMFFCRFSILSNPYVLCYNLNYLLIKTHEYFLVPHVLMGSFTGAARSQIQNYNEVNECKDDLIWMEVTFGVRTSEASFCLTLVIEISSQR